jgi:hypothetical protein
MQTLPVGYNKDELVSQINANPERAEQLINEIESMEGNAGAIIGAITEVRPCVQNLIGKPSANEDRSCIISVTKKKA